MYHVPTGSAEDGILVGDRIWGNKFSYHFTDIKRNDLVIFDKPGFKYDRSNPFRYFWQKYIGIPVPLLGVSSTPENWVKRVIALPGDTVEGRMINGSPAVFINGSMLHEPYVNKYPLIRVMKTTGFFDADKIGPLPIPLFLRRQTHPRNYTYDPSKSLEDQPFYMMKEDEVVKDMVKGGYLLSHPFTPNYDAYGLNRDAYGPFVVPQGKYWVMGDSRKNSQDSRWWLFLDRDLIHGKASFVIYSVDSEEPFWLFELLKHPITFWTKIMRWSRIGKGIH